MSERALRIDVERQLRPKIKEFDLDQDKLATAAERMKMPEEVYQSLKIGLKGSKFQDGISIGGIDFGSPSGKKFLGRYYFQQHRIDLFPLTIQQFSESPTQFHGSWKAEAGQPTSLSALHNGILAHEMMHVYHHYMSPLGQTRQGHMDRQETALQRIKKHAYLGLSVGAVIGSEASAFDHSSLLPSTLLGAAAVGGTIRLREGIRNRRKQPNIASLTLAATEESEKYARAFEASQTAYSLFNGVINIELTKPYMAHRRQQNIFDLIDKLAVMQLSSPAMNPASISTRENATYTPIYTPEHKATT